MKVVSRDITQACNQSETKVSLPIYMRPAAEYKVPSEHLMETTKPLYGLPEAALHWFNTYLQFHVRELNMKSTAYDMCLLYTLDLLEKEAVPRRVTVTQTDDTLTLCNSALDKIEESKSKKFESKPKNIAVPNKAFLFNWSRITLNHENLSLNTTKHYQGLARISASPVV